MTMFAWMRTWLVRQCRIACLVLSNQCGAVPSSLTDEYEALLSTTLRNFVPRLCEVFAKQKRGVAAQCNDPRSIRQKLIDALLNRDSLAAIDPQAGDDDRREPNHSVRLA